MKRSKLKIVGSEIDEFTKDVYYLNYVNPFFLVTLLILLSIELVIFVTWKWTLKKLKIAIEDYRFLHSDKADSKWCGAMYTYLNSPAWVNKAGEERKGRKKYLKEVIKRRAILIKKATKS